jgi:DNA-binding NarL/FixJ family response regulator
MDPKVILLVEDDPLDQALSLRSLRRCNIVNDVVVARDGTEALDYLFGTGSYAGRDPRVVPQFVLLDLKLPDMSGLEVLQQIRSDERTRRVPVVVFSSSSAEEDLVKSYDFGANSFVRKPVGFEQFLEATSQLGLYWLVVNQVARVLIVDDHEVVRDGVKKILNEQLGASVFGEASTDVEALRLAREQNWDIALVDLSLGRTGGLEVLKQLKKVRPKLPVLVLSMQSEEQCARRAFRAGAAGYVTKDIRRTDLVEAVTRIIEGGRYVSPTIAEKLVVDLERGKEGPAHENLSDREFEVLRLIASGKTVGEIAGLLSLSDKTISTYRARILEKMELHTNAQLTHYAIQNKLVD